MSWKRLRNSRRQVLCYRFLLTRDRIAAGHADHRPKSVSLTGEPSGLGLGASRLAATSLPPAAPRSNGSGTPKSVEGSQSGTVTAAESAPYAATLPNGTAVTPTSVSLKAPNEGSLCAPDFIKRLSKDSGTSPSKGTPKVRLLQISQSLLGESRSRVPVPPKSTG